MPASTQPPTGSIARTGQQNTEVEGETSKEQQPSRDTKEKRRSRVLSFGTIVVEEATTPDSLILDTSTPASGAITGLETATASLNLRKDIAVVSSAPSGEVTADENTNASRPQEQLGSSATGKSNNPGAVSRGVNS